ncbi:MAG: galactose mutarotase [Labilithrix sp.]
MLETVVLESETSVVHIAPERGGMATRFTVGGRRVFYLDEATLTDLTKNVRGGNPVLFPSPGKLVDDSWTHGKMGQHGFARSSKWEVTDQTKSAVSLRLTANDATRAVYPWNFVASYIYRLDGPKLRIEQRFESFGEKPMPFGAGFHPYFHVPQAEKAHARIPTQAKRAWDNVAKREIEMPERIDLTAKEVDLHLHAHGGPRAALELRDARIDIRCSEEFERWVVWTQEGKDFVCLEPWTSPGNALNSGEGLLFTPPPRELWTEISVSQ